MSNKFVQPSAALIRIRHVVLVNKGSLIASPREALWQLPARKGGEVPGGYDIWYSSAERRFRFDFFEGGKFTTSKWIDASRIENWEEWDIATPPPVPGAPDYPKSEP